MATNPNRPADIPTELVAGDSWQWTRDLGDYPASAWELSYVLRLHGNPSTPVVLTAAADSDTHVIAAAHTATSAYPPGEYSYQAYVTHRADSDRFQIDAGRVIVKPNFATSDADPRSQVKRTLDALNATIEGNASDAVLTTTLNGVTIGQMSPQLLLEWRDAYAVLYRKELAEAARTAGKTVPETIGIRFTRAC